MRIIALRFYKYFAPLGLNVHYIYSQNLIFNCVGEAHAKREPQRGDIFIANAIGRPASPSGATHITLGVAPLGLNADYRPAFL
jgi:hypothetical protein